MPPLNIESGEHLLKLMLEAIESNMSLLDLVDSKRDYQALLEKTRAGQLLQSHIDSMEGMRRMNGQPLCAQQMTSDLARVLLTKMKGNRQWLGLPASDWAVIH